MSTEEVARVIVYLRRVGLSEKQICDFLFSLLPVLDCKAREWLNRRLTMKTTIKTDSGTATVNVSSLSHLLQIG